MRKENKNLKKSQTLSKKLSFLLGSEIIIKYNCFNNKKIKILFIFINIIKLNQNVFSFPLFNL